MSRLIQDEPTVYHIRIQGAVDPKWSDYLGGLDIAFSRRGDPPITTLTGSVTDQAALMGILDSLYNMGFPILAVECQLLTQE